MKIELSKMKVEWFGHAGHLCISRWCNFHLTTRVGDYLISTVGDYRSKDTAPRENIGFQRAFETMVFRAGEVCAEPGCDCGMPAIDGSELDFRPYNDSRHARDGHMAMIEKYLDMQR